MAARKTQSASPDDPQTAHPAADPTAPEPTPAEDAGRDSLQFEQSLNELESLVEKLETGELSLEESLQTFERGVRLSRICQRALDAAEQRVERLSQGDAVAPGGREQLRGAPDTTPDDAS